VNASTDVSAGGTGNVTDPIGDGAGAGGAAWGGTRWRLEIEHTTTFTYDAPVRLSYNETRLLPIDDERQRTVTAGVWTTPNAHQQRYTDYWGTRVVAFDVPESHRGLEIRLEAVVETPVDPWAAVATEADAAWSDLVASAPELDELLLPTPYTAAPADLVRLALGLRDGAGTPRNTVLAAASWANGAIEYETGVTGVHTSAAEALEAGKGVCQDLAHLTIALLRACGVPARYVSGYLHPKVNPVVGEEAVGQSHAWVEAWTGAWWPVDPTNLLTPGPRHVVVARGRDYADVAPVRGIYAGSAGNSLTAKVTVTRTA
jgi:transglutaminase-like putative cysteine protease